MFTLIRWFFLSLNNPNSKGVAFNFRRHRVPHGLLCGGRSAGATVASDRPKSLCLMVGISDKLPLSSCRGFQVS